jgi:tetratricopeptide (TPR) repeat protein
MEQMARARKSVALPAQVIPPERGWTVWHAVAGIAGIVFAIAATSAAIRETPTIDEYAHVPAGLLHWRQGRFDMYRNNPPPGKMWLALPLALDASVISPSVHGSTVSWGPWQYGMDFERQNADRYLGLMTRARLMNVPLVLALSALVFYWCRQLYGPFAAGMSSSLLLLSPTILAHGHLATPDVATALTMLGAVLAVRWATQAPGWRRMALVGAALGAAMLVKFSSLYLVPLLPLLYVTIVWRKVPAGGQRFGPLALQVAAYLATAWLVVNLGMGFSGTFDTAGSLDLGSRSVRELYARVPDWLPLGLPRAYIEGIDALKFDIEVGGMSGYLHGQWSEAGWASYYFIAYAIKESEPVVILTVLSFIAFPLVVKDWREAILVVAPPAVLLIIAAFLNTLCLGIRYILPAFPFLFVMFGSCFAWAERRWARRPAKPESATATLRKVDRRWLVAAPVLLYAVALTAWVHPSYLCYFNRFIGGPAQGAEWLVDSNLDWGQDLYRVKDLAKKFGVDRWQMLYFGHVDPSRYGIEFDVPAERPEFVAYAASVNYWKGISYAILHEDGRAEFMNNRVNWLKELLPSEQLDSWVVFDLRPETLNASDAARDHYNAGLVHFVRGEHELAVARLEGAIRREPGLAQAHFALGGAYRALGQEAPAIKSLRQAVRLRKSWDEALNRLAWQLATSPQASLRNPREAVELAEQACAISRRENLTFLETLIVAYAGAGRRDEALQVCRECIDKATAAGMVKRAEVFRQTENLLESQRTAVPRRTG